jgi:predicted DNA-binding transcriptional regulator AlpA
MKKLLTWDELPEPARFSKPHLRLLEKQKKFPQRVRISPLRHAWVEAEVIQWIADRVAERDAAAA